MVSGARYSVSIFRGNGDGGFAPEERRDVGVAPFDVAAADLTGNGRLDLVLDRPER